MDGHARRDGSHDADDHGHQDPLQNQSHELKPTQIPRSISPTAEANRPRTAAAVAFSLVPGPRAAVATVFVIHGVLFASWTAHVPQVKAQAGLDDAGLGLALIGAPVGSVAAVLTSALLLHRFGSPRVVAVALIGYCASGVLVGRSGSLISLAGALAMWGAFMGFLDTSMNTQAVAVERTLDRQLMTGLHGRWSLGAFAGAGLGALGVAAGVSLTVQLAVLGAIAIVVGACVLPGLVPDPPPIEVLGGEGPTRRLSWPVIALGLIALASMLAEGAAADWAAVYLRGSVHATATVAGFGYAVFAFGMVVIRLSGDRLLARFGARRLLPTLALIGVVGFGGGLLLAQVATGLIGFLVLGFALGLVVPAVFSACGRLPGISAGTAISTAAGLGWFGFLVGPPVIGQLAGATSLSLALVLLPLLLLGIAVSTATNRAMDLSGR